MSHSTPPTTELPPGVVALIPMRNVALFAHAAKIESIDEPADASAEAEALAIQLRERTIELLSLLPSVPAELVHALQTTRGPAELADIAASAPRSNSTTGSASSCCASI